VVGGRGMMPGKEITQAIRYLPQWVNKESFLLDSILHSVDTRINDLKATLLDGIIKDARQTWIISLHCHR
jgi:hypothetical protein